MCSSYTPLQSLHHLRLRRLVTTAVSYYFHSYASIPMSNQMQARRLVVQTCSIRSQEWNRGGVLGNSWECDTQRLWKLFFLLSLAIVKCEWKGWSGNGGVRGGSGTARGWKSGNSKRVRARKKSHSLARSSNHLEKYSEKTAGKRGP